MSNHSGGYMLAELLSEFHQIGLFEAATSVQRTQIAKALWRLKWEYDCNWGEILNTEMAHLLKVCLHCGKTDTAINEQAVCQSCAG